MTTPAEITTDRLVLRQWRDTDCEPFWAMCRDPQVMEFLLPVADRAASDAMVTRVRARMAEHGYGLWAAQERTSGSFMGFIGIQVPGTLFPFSPCVEVGWRLAASFWGKGYATEGAQAALQFGFDQLALPEIVAFTTLNNQRSRAVMDRLGMRQDAATFEHPAVPQGHPIREHCLYRLTREAWAANGVHAATLCAHPAG